MSSIGDLLRQQGSEPVQKSRTTPLWKGPEVDGITFSMLSRFLVDRERFRLRVIEGLRPVEKWDHYTGYGHMWHLCEEHKSKGDWDAHLKGYVIGLNKQYRLQQEEITKWYEVCRRQFPVYLDWWARHPQQAAKVVLSEYIFNVPYHLPSGRIVRLRGKLDEVNQRGDGYSWLTENKTKSNPDLSQISRQLSFDLQTMIYLTALTPLTSSPIRGVLYNVVRRPLSGGKGTIVQKKGSKNVPAETKEQYYNRLAKYIKDEPDTYFYRWDVVITQKDVLHFCKTCLEPILEQLCDWWEWVSFAKTNNLNVWDNDVVFGTVVRAPYTHGSAIHWRHPFGVYNPLNEGGSTDLDEYLASGSEVGLHRVDTLFEELQ
jgi:hypothetical protein